MQLLWKTRESNWSFWSQHIRGNLKIFELAFSVVFVFLALFVFPAVFVFSAVFVFLYFYASPHLLDHWDDFGKFWLCLHFRLLFLIWQPLVLARQWLFGYVRFYTICCCCWQLLRSWKTTSIRFYWTSSIWPEEDLMRWQFTFDPGKILQPQLGVDLVVVLWAGSPSTDQRLHAWNWRRFPLPWRWFSLPWRHRRKVLGGSRVLSANPGVGSWVVSVAFVVCVGLNSCLVDPYTVHLVWIIIKLLLKIIISSTHQEHEFLNHHHCQTLVEDYHLYNSSRTWILSMAALPCPHCPPNPHSPCCMQDLSERTCLRNYVRDQTVSILPSLWNPKSYDNDNHFMIIR